MAETATLLTILKALEVQSPEESAQPIELLVLKDCRVLDIVGLFEPEDVHEQGADDVAEGVDF